MLRLENYYTIIDTDDEYVYIKNGAGEIVKYEYTMTLNPEIPDDLCHRVFINNEYYHF